MRYQKEKEQESHQNRHYCIDENQMVPLVIKNFNKNCSQLYSDNISNIRARGPRSDNQPSISL
jgi:hypothetical protein